MYAATGGYPYFIQAYGKAVWDLAPASPMTASDVAVAAPEAEAELAVGFFGSRYERATPGEREYLRAMADVAVDPGGETDAVPTADVAAHLGRKPQSLSRRETPSSRRASSTQASEGGSPSRCPTSGATSSTTPEPLDPRVR